MRGIIKWKLFCTKTLKAVKLFYKSAKMPIKTLRSKFLTEWFMSAPATNLRLLHKIAHKNGIWMKANAINRINSVCFDTANDKEPKMPVENITLTKDNWFLSK